MPALLAALVLANPAGLFGRPADGFQRGGTLPFPVLHVRIEQLVKAHKGKAAVAVKNLRTGEGFYINENEPMPTASLIKLPVMIEVYQQAAEGKIKLTDPITLRKENMVPGSGVLTDLFP